MDWTRWTGPHSEIVTDDKQMQWDVRSADMKCLATMAKNLGSAIDTKKKKKR